MVRVKICGITNRADAAAAVRAGADALGFMFDEASPRRVTPSVARAIIRTLPPFVTAVGVFTDLRPVAIRRVRDLCRLGAVQLHGRVTADLVRRVRLVPVVRAIQVRTRDDVREADRVRVALVHFDAHVPGRLGGTGVRFDWSLLRGARVRTPFILAGGLTPANVAAAVRAVRPYGVDVSTGVERSPGRKDAAKVARFIREAKSA
jgi:phosphoribosylanthranilate isomerase